MTTKLVYLTAGAGGMFCGSCLHDNALAKAMGRAGWDVQLVPLYTPIRTDEEDISVDRVFFGGINVYLQQKLPFFRYLPKWFDGFLDSPRLIRRVTSRAIDTNAAQLGAMALSMLQGKAGNQRKEVLRLVRWILDDAQPDVIISSNLLIAGFLTELKRLGSIPAFVTLQGDDVFLNALPEVDRLRCLQQIRENNRVVDGFIVHSQAFGSYMQDYFSIPAEKIHVTPLGLETTDFRRPPFDLLRSESPVAGPRTLGYLARLAPEKGLHELVEAFIELKRDTEFADVQLRLAGWLSPENRVYADQQWERLRTAGLSTSFEYLGVVDRQEKLNFLRSIDVLSVPTTHEEPKGLFALESLAAGVPVVLPRKGALTDVVEASQGGLLFEPNDRTGYLEALKKLLRDAELRQTMGQAGREFVLSHRNEETMARETMNLLSGLIT